MASGRKRSRAWVFTLNNPDKQLELEGQCQYAVWQLEEGEKETPHYQGYIQFKTKKSMRQVKRLVGKAAHVEVRKGTIKQAIAYCKKKDTRVEGPWQVGEEPRKGQGRRTDLETAARMTKDSTIAEVMEEYPGMVARYHRGLKFVRQQYVSMQRGTEFRAPKIMVLWGETGAGKTRKCMEWDANLYKLNHYEGGNVWFDGYDGQKTILIDEFYGDIKLSFMLQLLDGYALRVQVKGDFVTLNHETILITSNQHPEEWYNEQICTCALFRRLMEFGSVYKWRKEEEPEECIYITCRKCQKLFNKED
jgi:hypothetical protein